MIYKTQPRGYQARTAETVVHNDMQCWALNADPGLGKTKISIDIAANLFLMGRITWVMVVAPNGVHDQWASQEIPKHCPIPYTAYIYEASKYESKTAKIAREYFIESKDLKFLCVNVETFSTESGVSRIRELWKQLGREVLVCGDESHTIKNPKAKRSKTLHKVGATAKYKCTLTGTPVTNSPFDLWSQYEFLKHEYFGCNFFVFQHRHGVLVKRKTNARTFNTLAEKRDFDYVRRLLDSGQPPEAISAITGISESSIKYIGQNDSVSPYKNLDKLRDDIAPITFTLRREDHLPELPDKIFAPIYTELSPEQKRVYKDLKYRYMSEHEGKELSLDNKLTLGLRLMQITGGFFPYDEGDTPIPFKQNPKLDRLLEDLEETDGHAIIVWAVFRAEIEGIVKAVQEKFKSWDVRHYYGATAAKDRRQTIADFQGGRVNVLVANLASAGTGLNLQESCLHYFYSNDFSLSKRLQGEDRSYRIGQKNNVTYKDIYIKGTIDEKISKALAERKEILDFFRESSLDNLLSS